MVRCEHVRCTNKATSFYVQAAPGQTEVNGTEGEKGFAFCDGHVPAPNAYDRRFDIAAFRLWYERDQRMDAGPCPACEAVWVTTDWFPTGKPSAQERAHSAACRLMIWVDLEDDLPVI